jgi:hypothetical protein
VYHFENFEEKFKDLNTDDASKVGKDEVTLGLIK